MKKWMEPDVCELHINKTAWDWDDWGDWDDWDDFDDWDDWKGCGHHKHHCHGGISDLGSIIDNLS